MAVEVRIPTMLRKYSGGAASAEVEGDTVGEVLAGLDTPYPGMGERLFEDETRLRKFVNVYLEDEDIRVLDGLDTKIGDAKKLSIVFAVAGGR